MHREPESWEDRVARGWSQLFEDIRNWTSGKRHEHSYQHQGSPLVVNNVYTTESNRPVAKGVVFNFITFWKIIILIAFMTFVILLMVQPEETVEKAQHFIQWMQSI